eukprot:jgi/Picre1/27369/NNA_000336.t1
MEKMRDALGFREDIVEGEAFDRELQQRRKEERIAERKRREEERIQREIEREKEFERREREIRKAHEAGYYEKHERPDRYDGNVGAHSSDSYTSGSSLSRSPHGVEEQGRIQEVDQDPIPEVDQGLVDEILNSSVTECDIYACRIV